MIEVFYGDQIEHDSERHAVSALRRQLERQQISARLLVNFTVARGVRQIDLVIVTQTRCMNVELKSIDTALPLVGRANGPWEQLLPDGNRRLMDRNFYTQARGQTFGLSDVMRKLGQAGRVPQPANRQFFEHIDTVVCLAPRVPEGSSFERFEYVSVIGFDQLVDRLNRPGRGLPDWTNEHWGELTRDLGLYTETDHDPGALRRRADTGAVGDYCRRFREFMVADLHELIPVSADHGDQLVTLDAQILSAVLTSTNNRVLLQGESGTGKTHLARHTAIALTDADQIVIWLSADDYEPGRLSRSLARAVGPFSTEGPLALLRKASDIGAGITVIIDALETSSHREELLKQLNALLLQIPASVLITTAGDGSSELLAPATRIRLLLPVDQERANLARSYGTSNSVAESEVFRTRFDIAVAAHVITESSAEPSIADVLDSYVWQLAKSETVRAGLRCLAQKMDTDISSVLTINKALLTLRRHPPFVSQPSAIDQILASSLISVRQSRLRFRHEQLARFLAAEQLVLSATTGTDLGHALSQPAHRDLRDYALSLEHDNDRRYDAIREIRDDQVFAEAAQGKFGAAAANKAIADIADVLAQATAAAPASTLSAPEDGWFGTWQTERRWPPTELALLSAAGICVNAGLLITEVGALFDATDTAMQLAMAVFRNAGHTAPIDAVVASTYGSGGPLPASIVAHGLRVSSWRSHIINENADATAMWHPNPSSWGRLYAAALLSRPLRHLDDAHNLPDLVQKGWRTGGYHIRLELLYAAQTGAGVLESTDRQRMIDVLDSLEPQHIFLSSTLTEVLASYELITPIASLEDIEHQITEVLANENDPDHRAAAQSIVANQFEDERILGPFSEAIGKLPASERLKLCAMAVLTTAYSIGYPWAVAQLADGVELADDMVGQALADAARLVRDDYMIRQEAVAAHLHALRGWAKVADSLPAAQATTHDPYADAWRSIDQLIFNLFRSITSDDRSEKIWNRLLSDLATPTVVILCETHQASIHYRSYGIPLPHDLLLGSFPDRIRQLLEGSLTRLDQFESPQWRRRVYGLGDYIVRILGAVGVSSTADMLRPYLDDPKLGPTAVNSIRAIEARELA